MGSGYFCPVCKMEIVNVNNHIDCPGPNRNSGPFPGNVMGGRGICSKCGEVVNNVAYHESFCGKGEIINEALVTNKVNFDNVCKNDKQRIKELEEENKKLRAELDTITLKHPDEKVREARLICFFEINSLRVANEKLKNTIKVLNEKISKNNRRLNRFMDDSYNDIMPDRDDYR